jgi:hypothetical protein
MPYAVWVRTDYPDEWLDINKAFRLWLEPVEVSENNTIWHIQAQFIFEGERTVRSFDNQEEAQELLKTLIG